jgi:hypothetical protein
MSRTFIPSEMLGAQPDEHEITWQGFITNNEGYLLNKRWKTIRPLKHIANPATGDIRERTQALIVKGFNIPNDISPTGIKVEINGQRNGRICDEIIQLWYQGELIGDNNFFYLTDANGNLKITNQSTYGGPANTWGTALTSEMLSDPEFGIMVKFQSHPYFPHQDIMILDSVSLTVYEE